MGTYNLTGTAGSFTLTGEPCSQAYILALASTITTHETQQFKFGSTIAEELGLGYLYGDVNGWVVGYPKSLSSTISVHLSQVPSQGSTLMNTVNLHGTLTPDAVYHLALANGVKLSSLDAVALTAVLSNSVHIHPTQVVQQAVTLIHTLKIMPRHTPDYVLQAVLNDVLALTSLLSRANYAALASTLHLTPVLSDIYQAVVSYSNTVDIHGTLGETLQIIRLIQDEVEVDDTNQVQAIYNWLLEDTLDFGHQLFLPSGGRTTWALNTRTGAVTEYTGGPWSSFNSMVKMGQLGAVYLGASSTGLYTLLGSDDAGTPIVADMVGGLLQFTGSKFTSFKTIYLGVRASGEFLIKLRTGDGKSYVYQVNAQPLRTTRVELGKGLRARYFTYELVSIGGQDFDVDSLEFLPIISQRRI